MSKKFFISIKSEYVLSVNDLWPDGDAPENPTEEDVLTLIEDGGGVRVIQDWNLPLEIDVFEEPPRPRKYA